MIFKTNLQFESSQKVELYAIVYIYIYIYIYLIFLFGFFCTDYYKYLRCENIR